MRILLQDKKTGLYFDKSGVLTHEIEAAEDFGTSQRAMDHARLKHLCGAQVVATFLDNPYVNSIAFDTSRLPRARAVTRRTITRSMRL